MLFFYTSFFTIPFLYVLFYIFSFFHSFGFSSLAFSFSSSSESFSFIFTLLLFFVFAVKLPIYGLHAWLPMAHVEAPTFGSIILAGVLLKLGGVGLIRCSFFLEGSLMRRSILAFFIVFLLYSTLVCCFQSDFKRLIAYSSVSHMMVLPILLFFRPLLRAKAIVLVMVFHGIRSPLLFSIVGFSYSIFSSRNLLVMRGLMVCSPLFSFISVMAFMFSCCIPPFPSFVAEAFFFISSLGLFSFS